MHVLTDLLTSWIDAAPSWTVYLIAVGAVYLETSVVLVGLVLPSEAILIAAGVVAACAPTAGREMLLPRGMHHGLGRAAAKA